MHGSAYPKTAQHGHMLAACNTDLRLSSLDTLYNDSSHLDRSGALMPDMNLPLVQMNHG